MKTFNLERQTQVVVCVQITVLTILLSILMISLPVRGESNQDPLVSASQEERNKEIVINFYRAVFDDHKVAEAFRKFAAPDYIQHSPLATDVQSTIDFLQSYLDNTPGHGWELKRALAEGNLVALHIHSWSSPEDPGRAIVDIFRVEDGLVVEHWEVIQPVIKMEDRSMF